MNICQTIRQFYHFKPNLLINQFREIKIHWYIYAYIYYILFETYLKYKHKYMYIQYVSKHYVCFACKREIKRSILTFKFYFWPIIMRGDLKHRVYIKMFLQNFLEILCTNGTSDTQADYQLIRLIIQLIRLIRLTQV